MRTRRRQEATARGLRGERVAAWSLRLKGYRIVERGLRNPMGEIDIIARRGRVLAFIEVKTRTTLNEALNAVSNRQRQRIERAASSFVSSRPEFGKLDIRFDVIAVLPGRWPRHIPDAWRPS